DPAPRVSRQARGVLMGPVDRRVDRHDPVDLTSSVGLGQQPGEDRIPCPVPAEPLMTFPQRLPRTETLGHITPGHPAAIPEHDPLDDLTMITKRPRPPLHLRHQRRNPIPLSIGQLTATTHPDSITDTQPPT